MPSSPKLPASLLQKILLWTLLALLILVGIAGGISYRTGYQESSDFQKENLKNIATLIANNTDTDSTPRHQYYQTDDSDGLLRIDVWQKNETALLPSPNRLDHTASDTLSVEQMQLIPQGMSKQTIEHEVWQIYRLDNAHKTVIVRQNSDFQDEMATNSATQSIIALLVAMVIFFSILIVIMWRAFQPLRQLSEQVSLRQEHDLNPLTIEGLPREILPLVTAINQLLVKVKANIEKQQRFIADASHELRSPLTAISLQLQHLQRLTTENKVQAGLDKMALRVKRSQDLVEQLLTLARLNANQDRATSTPISPIIEQAINFLLPIIDHKQLELNVDIHPQYKALCIGADATAVLSLIKNILQNAVLYTPEKGQVSIKLGDISQCPNGLKNASIAVIGNQKSLANYPAHQPILQIIDTGHGIAPSQYQQAFEPFIRLSQLSQIGDTASNSDNYNNKNSDNEPSQQRSDVALHHTAVIADNLPKGTGLGLAMVKSICEQTGISLFLAPSLGTIYNSSNNQGLCVTLVLPISLPLSS